MSIAANKKRSPSICLTDAEYTASKKLADREERSWSNWAAILVRAEIRRQLGEQWRDGLKK